MPNIGMNQFIDYMVTSGGKRVQKVREIKQTSNLPYDPAKDYYKKIRDNVRSYEQGNLDEKAFRSVDDWKCDKRKKRTFADSVEQYLGWRDTLKGRALKIPAGTAIFGELSIRCSIDLAVKSGQQSKLIKFYFKKERLPANRIPLILALMKAAYPLSSSEVGILDVRRSMFSSTSSASDDLNILLSAESSSFMQIWNAV